MPRLFASLAVFVALAAALVLASTVGALGVAGGTPVQAHQRANPTGPEAALRAPTPVRTLRLRYPMVDLAAEGVSAALSWSVTSRYFVGCHVAIWQPRTGKLVRLGPRKLTPRSSADCSGFGRIWSQLAYANGRVMWIERNGNGTGISLGLVSATIKHPSFIESVAGTSGCCAGTFGQGTHLGGLVGRGRLLAFSTWTNEPQVGFPVAKQVIWRLAADQSGLCPLNGESPMHARCVKVSEASGPLAPLDVDAGRIVVLRGTSSIELLDQAGRTLRAFTPTSTPLAAVLSGPTLAVLVQGALEVYDTEAGALPHTWPLPAVPSGGRCSNDVWACPQVRLQLVAAVRGLALYLLDGKAHLLRLRDGRDVTIGRAVAADLTTEGLFYTFRGSGYYRGRVRFVPYAHLPLKP
jgi:hypothetical protein